MKESEIPKIALEYKVESVRGVGRHRVQWDYCGRRDIQKLGVKNRWLVAKDKDTLRRIVKEIELDPDFKAPDGDDDDDDDDDDIDIGIF